jgi:hypothetical protein
VLRVARNDVAKLASRDNSMQLCVMGDSTANILLGGNLTCLDVVVRQSTQCLHMSRQGWHWWGPA